MNNTEQITDNDLTIYPNPADDILNIKLTDTFKNAVINIYNPLGQLVYSDAVLSKNFTIDISNFNIGVYILELKNAKKVIKSSFIVE